MKGEEHVEKTAKAEHLKMPMHQEEKREHRKTCDKTTPKPQPLQAENGRTLSPTPGWKRRWEMEQALQKPEQESIQNRFLRRDVVVAEIYVNI